MGGTHLSSFVDGPVFLAQFARDEIQIEGRFALAALRSGSLAVLFSTLLPELFLLLSNLTFESGDLVFESCSREVLSFFVNHCSLPLPISNEACGSAGPVR